MASDAGMLPIPSSPMKEVKVRWMTNNNVSCEVHVNKKCKVAYLMAQIEEKVGIPVEEQNLFLGPKELVAIDTIPPLGADDLQLVRAKSILGTPILPASTSMPELRPWKLVNSIMCVK